MFNKIYIKFIYKVFITRFLYVSLIFSSLIFIMNILEELKFFKDQDIGIGQPIFLTILNLPSILFEIFPFIILITTQFFFIKLQNNSEILIFKNNGVNNLKIISYICFITFLIGLTLITLFHFISSNMKHNYFDVKNKYTKDNKYLAVITENGLWIKDSIDNKSMIIHAEKINRNILNNSIITIFDDRSQNEKTILAPEIVITSKKWNLKKATIINNNGSKEVINNFILSTNFDYLKINSLFSNLDSLNIYKLFNQKKDFENVGLNVSDIDIKIYELILLPVSLMIFCLVSSILMLKVDYKKSVFFALIIGILLSVMIYYIYYFFELLGNNNKIPIFLAVWLPNLLLLLSCMVGIVDINEK